MIDKGEIVLLDTNVIIEAHRSRRWKALVHGYRFETVECCCVELATGDRRRSDYVEVNVEELRRLVTVHEVSKKELAQSEVKLARPDLIDPGEKELLAHAFSKPGGWRVSASDRAAIIAGHELGMLDRFVPLEALARTLGLKPQLKRHFTENWLSALRTDILLGGTQ